MTYCKDYVLCGNFNCHRIVVYGSEAFVFIKYGNALSEFNGGRNSVFADNANGSPAVFDFHSVGLRLFDFLFRCGHFVSAFKTEHRHAFCAASCGNSCRVYRNVTAADNDRSAFDFASAAVCRFQELDRCRDVRSVFSVKTEQFAALTAYRDIKRLIALRAKSVKRYVLADLDSEFYFNAHFAHYIYFCVNDVLGKFI